MSIKKDLLKYTPRQEQSDALDFIMKTKSEKPETKFFLMNMPVGVGKSHLSMMIADWYISKIDKDAKVDVITAGKLLQDQYDDTYSSVHNLKGKENYECTQYKCSCANGKEFNRLNKTSCTYCPYDDSRLGYITGKIGLTNFYLYLIYALYNQGIMDQRKSNVLIVDEAHDFDEVMSDFISVKITEATVKKLKFTNEGEILRKLKKISTLTQYITFLEYLRNEIFSTIAELDKSMSGNDRSADLDKRKLKIGKVTGGQHTDVKLMQVVNDLNQYAAKIDLFLKEYAENPHNWVMESSYNEKTKTQEFSLEPIWAYDYLDKYVWSNYDMVILMSGTILDKDLFSELNGLDKDKSVYYSIPSPFPLQNRPIYYMPLGKMSYQNKEEAFKNFVPYMYKILKKYEGKKGLIHTNSFELANWIRRDVQDSRLIFHDSNNKEDMLRKHFEEKDPTVFVSPSVGTGVSFDHEKSRFQVIAKIPYPSLGSQKNKLRQKNNPEWYAWKTICGLMQMTGRSVRSKTDFADTIIIDSSFGDILRYSSKYLPKWFQEAIKKIEVKTNQ